MIQLITIPISVKLIDKNNEFVVVFTYNKNQKKVNTIFDSRYIIQDKFRLKIRKILQPLIDSGHDFKEEIKTEGKIEYVFIKGDGEVSLKPHIFKIVDYAPEYPGCSFCIHRLEQNKNYFRCKIKNKLYAEDIKNCSIFKQKELFKS